MKSWKTSLFGSAGLITVLCDSIAKLTDGDPATNPNWTLVITAGSVCIGLLFARDNNKTSEQVGAGPKV